MLWAAVTEGQPEGTAERQLPGDKGAPVRAPNAESEPEPRSVLCEEGALWPGIVVSPQVPPPR